jgi:hypothetical protein
MNYIVVSDKPASDLVTEAHSVTDQRGNELRSLQLTREDGQQRLVFSVDATRREHKELMDALHRSDVLRNFEVKAGTEPQ